MSNTTIKTYEIDGKTYEQSPMVFGQWQQLNRVIDGLEIPSSITPRSLTVAFSDRLDQILAIVLTEKDQSPRDKNLDELAKHLTFSMPPEQVAEVVTDFFVCNPIPSVLNLVVGVTNKIRTRIETVTGPIGSNNVLSPSQEETSSSETTSSGE